MTEPVFDVILNGGVTENFVNHKPVGAYPMTCKYKRHYSLIVTFTILAAYHWYILNINRYILNSNSFIGNGMCLCRNIF